MNEVTNNSGRVLEPDLRDVLVGLKREIKLEINCISLGTIKTFYPSTQTVDVIINYKKLYKAVTHVENFQGQSQDKIVEYPMLFNCPVVIMKGGSGHLTFPITAGDTCLVLFGDRDIDTWFETGDTTQIPNSDRVHDLSDGIALVGIFSKANNLSSYKTDGVQLVYGSCVIELDTLIKIAVGAQTLKDALDSLCTALTGWGGDDPQGGTVSPNAATISAINAAKAKIDAVLK